MNWTGPWVSTESIRLQWRPNTWQERWNKEFRMSGRPCPALIPTLRLVLGRQQPGKRGLSVNALWLKRGSYGHGVTPSLSCVVPSPTRVLLNVSDDPQDTGLTFNYLPLIWISTPIYLSSISLLMILSQPPPESPLAIYTTQGQNLCVAGKCICWNPTSKCGGICRCVLWVMRAEPSLNKLTSCQWPWKAALSLLSCRHIARTRYLWTRKLAFVKQPMELLLDLKLLSL